MEYYVAINGSASGDGSQANPWDLATAIGVGGSVQGKGSPGDTLWIRGGVYKNTGDGWYPNLAGSQTAPLIVRNYKRERVIIDGRGGEMAWATYGHDTWYWGLEICDSNPTRNSSVSGSAGQPNAFGIAVYSPRTKFIHCIVHDTAEGFSAYDACPDCEFHGNLSFYNGWNAPDRTHGHGMYLQNLTGSKIVEGNFVGDNFCEGLQVYGSGSANVVGFRVNDNSMWNTDSLPYPHFQHNLIAANGSGHDNSFLRNWSWLTPEADYGFVTLGQWMNWQDSIFQDNVLVGGYDGAEVGGGGGSILSLIFRGNKIVTRPSAPGGLLRFDDNAQTLGKYDWDANEYWGGAGIYYKGPGRLMSFPEWQNASGFDKNSVYHPELPTGIWVRVVPSKYEQGRSHVTVLNFDSAPQVSIDLSSTGLKAGDSYSIMDAQNMFGFPVAGGTYNGQPVSVPTNLTAKAVPTGLPKAPDHTAPRFLTLVILPVNPTDVVLGKVSVQVTPTIASLYHDQTQVFSAAVTGGTGGVNWSINPATGLGTITGSGLFTAAPKAMFANPHDVIITAQSVDDITASASAVVHLIPGEPGSPPPPPPPPPTGYTWKCSGTLPDGLAFSPAGLLSGTLTKEGTFTWTVTVMDTAGNSAQITRSMVVGPANTPPPPPPPPPTLQIDPTPPPATAKVGDTINWQEKVKVN